MGTLWERVLRVGPRSVPLTNRGRETVAGLLFATPWLIGFFGLVLYPLISSLWYSLTNYSILGSTSFVGVDNYTGLLRDPTAQQALYNTGYMVLVGLPVGLVVALAIALLMNVEIRGISLYRTLIYLPSVTPVVAATLVWVWMLNGQSGLLNAGLSLAHLVGPNWLNDPGWSKPAVIMMTTWGTTGSTAILILAGLKNIPAVLYEASEIDGASRLAQFRHITIPMLSPTLFFLMVTGLIAMFQIFAQAYVATNGGPANSTLFYVYYLFNVGFGDFHMGYASAMAWVLFVVILIVTLLQMRLARHWVHYD